MNRREAYPIKFNALTFSNLMRFYFTTLIKDFNTFSAFCTTSFDWTKEDIPSTNKQELTRWQPLAQRLTSGIINSVTAKLVAGRRCHRALL